MLSEYGRPGCFSVAVNLGPKAGVFARILESLTLENADFQTLMPDATHVGTRRIAASGVKSTGSGRAIERTKDGLNSKLHPVCDGVAGRSGSPSQAATTLIFLQNNA